MTVATVEQVDALPPDWPAKNLDYNQCREVACRFRQPRSGKLDRHEFEMPELGTWKLVRGEFSVLVEIPVSEMRPMEGDWRWATRHISTQTYARWQRQGHEPPPLEVIRTNRGNLNCLNRRRWLAACEAGVETLKCWYSPIAKNNSSAKFTL